MRETKPRGRPTEFKPECADRVTKLALLGLTDEEISGHLGISRATLSTWKLKHPELLDALKKGREEADGAVSDSLYKQACSGNVVACIFWLKNRHPKLWRDRHLLEHSGGVEVAGVPNDVLQTIRKIAQRQANEPATNGNGRH